MITHNKNNSGEAFAYSKKKIKADFGEFIQQYARKNAETDTIQTTVLTAESLKKSLKG